VHGVRLFARLHCRGEIHAACVHLRRVADMLLVVHYCRAKPCKVVRERVVMPDTVYAARVDVSRSSGGRLLSLILVSRHHVMSMIAGVCRYLSLS
jgi:hypothetical protein